MNQKHEVLKDLAGLEVVEEHKPKLFKVYSLRQQTRLSHQTVGHAFCACNTGLTIQNFLSIALRSLIQVCKYQVPPCSLHAGVVLTQLEVVGKAQVYQFQCTFIREPSFLNPDIWEWNKTCTALQALPVGSQMSSHVTPGLGTSTPPGARPPNLISSLCLLQGTA